MSTKDIRLGSTISFDEQKERDIIERIEYLTSQRKLGEFISNLLRLSLKDVEIWEQFINKKGCLYEMSKIGMLPGTDKFFIETGKEVDAMKHKVDCIYKMCVDIYTNQKFGKTIGIEQRTDAILSAQFLLQSQLNAISEKLGVSNFGYVYESNKIKDTSEYAERVLKHILETYDGIVSEVKVARETIEPEYVHNPKVVIHTDSNRTTERRLFEDELKQVEKTTAKKKEATEQTKQEEKQPIVFESTADFDLLSNFCGD